ncbi:DUF1367 family protein [Bordetella sp. BOR01]|uniref:DUF1367 family protein n=1 Tax=Bordetella sp. BOR01 TaxID=2854779 RepID=UPI001C47A7B6|nr:DUF1367 family protein [Bordetella sp. BOR01]MBV7482502.1 DUF1367 family protein [Bordetella sp. BOR01]
MAEITLIKQEPVEISEEDRAIARRVIFSVIDGLGERGRRQWRRFWNRIFKLQPGEMLDIKTHQERLGWYHRRHMSLEQQMFEAQEALETFRTFRAWLKIGAGHVEYVPGEGGQLQAVPLSISYAELEQAEMEAFHEAAVTFLRSPRAAAQLWPHMSAVAAGNIIDRVLGGFGE